MSLFELGRVVMTSGIRDLIEMDGSFHTFIHDCLRRHSEGNWGEQCDEDIELNEEALIARMEGRECMNSIMSVYSKKGYEIWIITEWNGSVTTILLPEEY